MGRSDSIKGGRSSCLEKLRAEHRRFQQEIACIRSSNDAFELRGGDAPSHFIVAEGNLGSQAPTLTSPSCLAHSDLLHKRSQESIKKYCCEKTKSFENLPSSSFQKEQESAVERSESFDHSTVKGEDDPCVLCTNSNGTHVNIRTFPARYSSARRTGIGGDLSKDLCVDRGFTTESSEVNDKDTIRLTATALFTANKGQILISSTGSSTFAGAEFVKYLNSAHTEVTMQKHVDKGSRFPSEPSCFSSPSSIIVAQTLEVLLSEKRMHGAPMERISLRNSPTLRNRQESQVETKGSTGEIEASIVKQQARGANASQVTSSATRKAVGAEFLPSSSRQPFQRHEPFLTSASLNLDLGVVRCHCTLREPETPTMSDKVFQIREGKSNSIECFHDLTSAPQVVPAHESAVSSSCMVEQQSVLLEEKSPQSKVLPCPDTERVPAASSYHQQENEFDVTSVGRKERNGEKIFEHVNSILQLDVGLKNLESSNRARSALSRRLAGQIKHILETLDGSEPKTQISSTSGSSFLDNGLKSNSKSLEAKVNDPGKSLSKLARIPYIAMPRLKSQLTMGSKPEAAKATDAEIYLQDVVSALAAKPRSELFGQQETRNLDQEAGTLGPDVISTKPSPSNQSSPKVTSLLDQTLTSEKAGRMIGAKIVTAIEKAQNLSSMLRVAQPENCAVLPSLLPSVDHNTVESTQGHAQSQLLPDEANGPSDASEQSEISADALCQQRDDFECRSLPVRPALLKNEIHTSTEILRTHMLHSEEKDSGPEHCTKSLTHKVFVAQPSTIEKERNLQSVTDLISTQSIAANSDTDILRHTLSGEDIDCTGKCTSWKTESEAHSMISALKNRDFEEFGLGRYLPHATDKLNRNNCPSEDFLRDCHRKVENFKGSRMLENAAVQRRLQSSSRAEKAKSAISSGTKGYTQTSNFKAKKGLQDTSRAIAAENLARDIRVLMSQGKVTHPVLTPKSGESSNLDGSVVAAAQVVSQLTKDTSPKSTDDKWQKLVTLQEARSASAKNIIMNMIGGYFDYDQMYQELRELGDDRIRIQQHEKAQRKFMCLPNSVVGSTKLFANNSDTPHCKKGQVLRRDNRQNGRLRHGSMLVNPKSGSSTKRRRSTQSPSRETGNKLPRLGFGEIELRENIYNAQNLESAQIDTDVENFPATEKKYKVGHSMHLLQTFNDKVANSMLWNDQSETLGIDMDIIAEKKFSTNHRQNKDSAKYTRREDKIPAWVERICKPMQTLCQSHCKHAHEKFPVSSNLRRRSVRPAGAFFKVGKPINWMQQPMKVIKDEAQKRSKAASRSVEGSERLFYPVVDFEANNLHKKDTKHLVKRNIQQRTKDFHGKEHMTYVQKDKFENMLNSSSSLWMDNKYSQRYPSLQKIHSGIMPSFSVEEKPALSAFLKKTLSKSSRSNSDAGKEIPDNGLDLQEVSEIGTAPMCQIINSDKLKERGKSTGELPSASICTIEDNREKPGEWITEPNEIVAPISYPEVSVYGNAIAVLPEAASTSTVSSHSLGTIAAEKVPISSVNEMVGPEPGHTCETMQHQRQPFDLNAKNDKHLSQNEQKASSSTHVEAKYSKQPSFGYRTQLEEEVLKRALLEVILQSMLNEDNQQPATGDLKNKDHPSDLVAVSKTKGWSLGSSQTQGDMQSGQKQETISSSQTSTLALSHVVEYQTDTQASPVTQPSHSDLSQPLQSTYSSRVTACISHGGPCSSIGLSVLPWPVPMYVTADGRITATSEIPQFPLLQVPTSLCLSWPGASVALIQQVTVPVTSTSIAVTHPVIINDASLPNGSTKVHQEIAAGQEKDLEIPRENFPSPRTLNAFSSLPEHRSSLVPSLAPHSAIIPADSFFLDTPKCFDDGVIIVADAIARRHRPRQHSRSGLRLEEMRSFTYREPIDAHSLENEHCQEVSQAANEIVFESGRKQLVPNEVDSERQGVALGKVTFGTTSCRNMPSSESPCEEGMLGLKDKNKMDEGQEHATVDCEHRIVQLEQSKQGLVVEVMTQTEDFLRRDTATTNEMSCLPAEKLITEGGDYNHDLTLHRSYFQSTKWTKEEQSQLAAWSLIKNFSLSDTSPEHLSEQSLQSDECFLSMGEVNFNELGRTLLPLVSEDSTSSSSNKISESSTSSSKDSSSTPGTSKIKSGCVRCEPAVESEALLLSEGEFESGTVACDVEEVGQLHQQIYIEPGDKENKKLTLVSKLDEGFLRPNFFHEEEAAGSMSEGEVFPGYLGERGEIGKLLSTNFSE